MLDKLLTAIGNFSYRKRYTVLAVALLFFVLVFYLQSQANIIYLYFEHSYVTEIFPEEDTVVIVYDNDDEDKIPTLIDELSKDENVLVVQAYANTLGMELGVNELCEMLGVDALVAETLLYMQSGAEVKEKLSVKELIRFLSSDEIMENETFSSMLDADMRDKLKMASGLVDGISDGKEYTPEELSELLGVDRTLLELVYYASALTPVINKDSVGSFEENVGDLENAITNGVLSFEDLFAGGIPTPDSIGDLLLPIFKEIGGIISNGTSSLPGIDSIYDLVPPEKMSIVDLCAVISELSYLAPELLDEEQTQMISMLESICLLVERDVQMTPAQMVGVLPMGEDGELVNEDMMSLLYLVYSASEGDVSDRKVKVTDLFSFVKNDVINDVRFASFLDEDMLNMVTEGESMIEEGLAQLVGPEHSRMMITINYVFESPEMTVFYNDLYSTLDDLFDNDYYIVGNSAMSHEVSSTFNDEYLFISILTALAVFLVVAITFRKFSVPLLLICIIECAVFTMMGAMAVSGTDIYFIAVIIVQCILMGSLIDYGILFSSYYREVREELPVDKALPEVLKRSISAIATSSVILVIVTLVCGAFMTGAVGTILTALGIGSFAALLLVIFVLPSLLAIFDDVIIKKKTVAVTDVAVPAPMEQETEENS